MEMIDGPMISRFIEDSEEFEKYAEEKFKLIKQSESDQRVVESMALDGEESQNDRITTVDCHDWEEYKAELKEMMQAIAKGIGNTPVNMMIGEESLWLKIHEFEAARIMKEKEEEKRRNEEEEKRRNEEEKKKNEEVKKKMIKEEEREREREINGTPKKVEVMGVKKKKKNSFDFLNFCSCSGKQFAENN